MYVTSITRFVCDHEITLRMHALINIAADSARYALAIFVFFFAFVFIVLTKTNKE
jgi:hypothetical protein